MNRKFDVDLTLIAPTAEQKPRQVGIPRSAGDRCSLSGVSVSSISESETVTIASNHELSYTSTRRAIASCQEFGVKLLHAAWFLHEPKTFVRHFTFKVRVYLCRVLPELHFNPIDVRWLARGLWWRVRERIHPTDMDSLTNVIVTIGYFGESSLPTVLAPLSDDPFGA